MSDQNVFATQSYANNSGLLQGNINSRCAGLSKNGSYVVNNSTYASPIIMTGATDLDPTVANIYKKGEPVYWMINFNMPAYSSATNRFTFQDEFPSEYFDLDEVFLIPDALG